MNLIAAFIETAAQCGNRTAIVAGDGATISFADLARRSGALAEGWHRAGLRSGDRVLLAMPVCAVPSVDHGMRTEASC